MSKDTVIQVENLSNSYRLGTIGGGTLRGDLERWWAKLRGNPTPPSPSTTAPAHRTVAGLNAMETMNEAVEVKLHGAL